jgi:hypothetical protein
MKRRGVVVAEASASHSAGPVHLGHASVAGHATADRRLAGLVAGDERRVMNEGAGHRHELEALAAGGMEVLERCHATEEHERQVDGAADLTGEREEVHRLERMGPDHERPEERQRDLLGQAALGSDHGA